MHSYDRQQLEELKKTQNEIQELKDTLETEQASLTLTGFDWETSYKAIRLEVTRLGSQREITDSFNQTRLVSDKLYSKSVQEFHRKLSKVTWGTVELSTHDELNYDIYWNRIAEESQRSCLKEYQLYAYGFLYGCEGAEGDSAEGSS